MLEIILQLLLTLGLYSGGRNDKPVIVVDSNTGITYAIGVTNGTGGYITNTPKPETYYLVKDNNGTYRLVRK